VLERIYEYTFSSMRLIRRGKGESGAAGRAQSSTRCGVPARSGSARGDGDCGLSLWRRAYLTDVSAIPEESFALLEGLDILVLSALRHKPHPSHARGAGLGWSRRIGARQTG